MSFIKQHLIEISQYPREMGRDGREEWFYMKDYFFYDSNTKKYGHRDTVIPVSSFINKEEIPEPEFMKELINKKVYVIKRIMNFQDYTQKWVFDTTKLGESKND
jgi:hypothetical protein